MKKISLKKIMVFVLAIVLVASVFTGCSIIEYNEDRDMRQVVLEVKSFEMEYEVPFKTEYRRPDKSPVVVDGKTVMTTLRDAGGEPVHVPVVESDSLVFEKDDMLEGDNKVVYDKRNDYFTAYTIDGGKATSATIYQYCKITKNTDGTYTAVWQDIHNHNNKGYSTATKLADEDDAVAAVTHALPTVYYTSDDMSDGFFFTATTVNAKEKWTTPAEEYTKQQLIEYYNRSASSFEGQSLTLEEQFDRVIRGLYTLEFSYLEAERYILSGEPEWGLTEENLVKKNFYTNVDNAIKSEFADIYKDHSEEYNEAGEESDDSSTTYPVKENPGEGKEKDFEAWTPDKNYLGLGTDPDRSSLVREGIRRWLATIEKNLDNDNTISNSERSRYLDELKDLKSQSLESNEKLESIYLHLLDTHTNDDGNEEYTYSVMWYLYGESYDRNLKMSALETYVESTADISDNNISAKYDRLLAEQKERFENSLEGFASAVTGDSTILYYPKALQNKENQYYSYFYVKHILIPFPDNVSAELTSAKESGTYTDMQYLDLRQRRAPKDDAKSYPVYQHPDGENDTSKAYTVLQAYNHISQAVNSKATEKEKLEAFEDMIFLYNTDPGIFNKEMGYAVSSLPAKDGGPAETYVIEFATAARELKAEGKIGAISEPILGDFGYHILCLLKVPRANETIGLNEYRTAAEVSTAKDALSTDEATEKYESWHNERMSFYDRQENEYWVKHQKAYQDLIDR